MTPNVLTIDRLVFTGPGMTSARAERLRALIESELRRRLTTTQLPRTDRSITPAPVTVGRAEDDATVAVALAGRILAALSDGSR